tara:strand:- start:118 stop:699 length:582 start_codon:yes stop_codon:yes gene_type:complete
MEIWHKMKIDKLKRSQAKMQKPCIIWFTGLPGSGKSTIGDKLEQKLSELGKHTYLLDGDNLRNGLNKDLGFSNTDRHENIRRVSEVGKLMVDAGLIVIACFISPFKNERIKAKRIFDHGEFYEIYINTPLNICEKRDPKGLYKKARSGTLKNFTGIDSVYEKPTNPDLELDTMKHTPDELVDQIISFLKIEHE